MSPFPFLAFARRKPTGLTSAEMAALRGNAAARSGFLLAAAPFGRRAGQPSEGAPTDTARSPRARERGGPHLPLLGKECTTPGPQQEPEHRVLRSFPPRGHTAMARNRERSCGSWRRRRAVRSAGKRGQTRVGWCACPRLTLFATEWSAARRKPIRAAAMPLRSPISADVKARRLPTSGRRKFPSGNFRSARDLEGAKRVSRGQAQRANLKSPRLPGDRTARTRHRNPPGPSPFASKSGMSPFLIEAAGLPGRRRHRPPHSSRLHTRAPAPRARVFTPSTTPDAWPAGACGRGSGAARRWRGTRASRPRDSRP